MKWPTKGDPVLIEWLDATAHPGWVDAKEVKDKELSPIVSIGFFCGADKTAIRICQSLGRDDGEPGEILVVPKGWVKKWHRMRK